MTPTIALGSAAVGLLVTVQRNADKTLAMRLMHGEDNVSGDYAAAIVMADVTWTAVVEDVEGSAALVWRLDESDTAIAAGARRARLVITAGTTDTVLAIGEVVAQ